MMFNLSRKQLIYGSIFIGVTAIVLFVILVVLVTLLKQEPTCTDGMQNQNEEGVDCGGSCPESCIARNLKLVELVGHDTFYLGANKTSLLLTIQNPNGNYGARVFFYTVSMYDRGGQKLTDVNGRSFIYAGEIKYIFIPILDFSPTSLDKIEFTIKNPEWAPKKEFYEPKFDVINKETAIVDGQLRVSGSLMNTNRVSFKKVDIIAIFRDQYGVAIGASQTYLDDAGAGEARQFVLMHPPIDNMDMRKTDVFVFAFNP